jgi:hypothetical protein
MHIQVILSEVHILLRNLQKFHTGIFFQLIEENFGSKGMDILSNYGLQQWNTFYLKK